MNRDFWKNRNFTNLNPHHYPCPSCDKGYLIPENIKTEITPTGKEMDYYNYMYGIENLFTCFLRCNHNDCKEIVSANGKCFKDIVYEHQIETGEYIEGRYSTYSPQFFIPNLKLFKIDKQVREVVKAQINLSFAHYFHDLSSCGNRIRNSIELILDDLKAPNWTTKKGKKYIFPNLHQRIEHFGKRNKRLKKLLLAVKIIGNEGSHVGEIELEDILDAFEILEILVEETYVNNQKRIIKIADEIVVKNKPRSK